MGSYDIQVRGDRTQLGRLRRYIADAGIPAETVTVTDPQPIPRGVLDRSPLGQVELLDVVVSIVAGVSANAIYDQLKRLLARLQDDGKITLVDKSADDQSAVPE